MAFIITEGGDYLITEAGGIYIVTEDDVQVPVGQFAIDIGGSRDVGTSSTAFIGGLTTDGTKLGG